MSTVPLYLDLLGALPERYPRFFKKFGDLETELLKYDTENLAITKPVFVCGMARSGSTLLIEILASHPDVATHQYRDFPFLHVNYFWNSLKKFAPSGSLKKTERAHKDGMMVNAQSPEALDEGLWMSFFEGLHDPQLNNVLGNGIPDQGFGKFYREHILKLLLLRTGKRFACKNNYNISRIRYLKSVFPDALFVVPLRDPISHIFSCIKQHRLISEIQKKDARARRYMRRHGHHEFGIDFAPVNFGNMEGTASILQLWQSGFTLEAYARAWTQTHEYIYELLQDADLQGSLLPVRYAHICEDPAKIVDAVAEFCELDVSGLSSEMIQGIQKPSYYANDLSPTEIDTVNALTKNTADKLEL